MATARVTRPILPAQPTELRELIGMHNAAVKAMQREARGLRLVQNYAPAGLDSYADFAAARELLKEWHASPDGQAHRRAIDTYNAQAAAWNAQLKADKAARVASRETAKVRTARCNSCFSVPSVSGACNC